MSISGAGSIVLRALAASSLIATISISGQSAPAVLQDVDSAPAAQLKLPVPLVVEDVIVVDGRGQPVHGLTASDFRITENGKAITITSFEEHSASTTPSAAPLEPLRLGTNVFSNVPRAPTNGPLTVLLLDVLNTPLVNQAFVHQQILLYLKQLAPGARIAIFVLGTRLYFLQGFTSDPAVLQAAIERKQSGMRLSPLMANAISGPPGPVLAEDTEDMTDRLEAMSQNQHMLDAESAGVLATLSRVAIERQVERVRERMLYTLESLNDLARYLSMLPGHKNVIWFSGSFPLYFLPDENLVDPMKGEDAKKFAAVSDFGNDLRQTADLLAHARVAVYPVDARGLFTNPAFSASQQGSSFADYAAGSRSTAAANDEFMQQNLAEHATMNKLADETGGKAFYNTNGLKKVVDKVINYGENYYTIAYTPADLKWNGVYRKISIKANKPGLHLSYRNGYYADDPNAPARLKTFPPQSIMQRAMLPGGPDATQVLFSAMLVPVDKLTDQLSTNAHPDAAQMKPPYRNYSAEFFIDPRTLKITRDDKGVYRGAFELAISVYNRDGEIVNSAIDRLNIAVPEARYQKAMRDGVKPSLAIEAPATGDYFLRIVAHDLNSDGFGSLEVPLGNLKSAKEIRAAGDGENSSPPAK